MSERQHKIPDPPLPALEVNIDEDIDRITQDFTLLLAQNSMNSKKSLKKLQKATQEKSLEHQKRSLKHVWTGLLLNKKDSRIARLVRKELIKQTRISLSVKQCQQFIADQASKNLVTKPGKPELGYEYEYKSVARTTARKPTYIVVFGERITVNKWTELKIYFLSVLISKYPKLRDDKLLELRTKRNKPYFFHDADPAKQTLRKPHQVTPELWTELHASSKALEDTCRSILKLLNLPKNEFKIFFD